MNKTVIKSISDYLKVIESYKICHKTSYTVSGYTMFRGQSDEEWKLSPSLYRKNLFSAENLILTEMKHICPNEFLPNRFDTLVKMQHFGLPTRLLDTTTNPLVALYFACSENEKTNGVVYIFNNIPVSWSTDPLVELIMDFVYDYSPINTDLKAFLDRSEKKYAQSIHRLMPKKISDLLHYLTIPVAAVMPAKTNVRVEAQDGAFLIFGMKNKGHKVSTNSGTNGKMYYDFEPVNNIEDLSILNMQQVIIPAENKKQIMDSLDMFGINERKLFPDLTHQINYVVNDVKEHMF